jgi:hypothetical protein
LFTEPPYSVNPLKPFLAYSVPLSKGKEGQEKFLNPPHGIESGFKLLLRRLGAICGATTFTLAAVLAFAAVLAGFAAALTLARVLAFTSMLFFDLLIVLLVPLVLSAE